MTCHIIVLNLLILVILCHFSTAKLLMSPNIMVRGGVKKPPLGSMLKAFWLTLIDPSNEESLKNKKPKTKTDSNAGKSRHVKGRSLKD